MAESENNKPKTEKTSASVISSLPRLCSTTKLDLKDTSCNIPEPNSRSPKSRSVSNENHEHSGFVEQSKINLYKSKLTEFKNSDRTRFGSNSSLILISPRNYHGQIPVFHRHSLNILRMSPPVTRSPSPLKKISPKEKPLNKIKTITLDQETKKKTKTNTSRSPSPGKKATGSYTKPRSTRTSSPPLGGLKTYDKTTAIKRTDTAKQMTSPRMNSPTKRKSKTKVLSSSNFSLKGIEKGSQREKGDSSTVILKQASQPSLCKKEILVQPQEKISLDHLKNEVYSGDHRRLSFEKVHLCIEKSVENLALGESKRSYLVTYSSEELQNQEEISLSLLRNLSGSSVTTFSAENEKRVEQRPPGSKSAIRTLSGHELLLTPSMNLDLEKSEIECEDIEISKLLNESGETFDDTKEIHIFQDDANEYDSEVSTDGELTRHSVARQSVSKCNELHRKSTNSLWKSREADLLNDVAYRQSVYHPAVSRWQNEEEQDMEFRPKSKSIEDNFVFSSRPTERIIRSHSSNLKNKYTSQNFTTDNSNNNERSWASSFDKTDGKPTYNSVIHDVPLYGVKRIRTKKERVSGALLRFTLKMIRLLAIFNFWPGDNCHMLTSQSLRFAR